MREVNEMEDKDGMKFGPVRLPEDYRIWKGTPEAFFEDAAKRVQRKCEEER